MTLFRALLAFSLLTACSDDDSGGGDVALADIGATFGAAYCAKAFDCCTAAEIPQFFEGASITDEPGCVMFYTNVFGALTATYQASIDAGKLVYSSSAASQCVSALRAQACPDFASAHDPLQNECSNPFMGQVAANAACNFDEECVSGYCEGDVQFGTPRPGVCKSLPGSGAMCPDFDCAEGFQCQSGTCMALKADGASCYGGDECASGGCNGASGNTAGMCGVANTCNGM